MSMAGFDPFSSLERMLSRGVPSEGGARSLPLPVDVYRSGDAFIVEVDVPGLDPESLDLQVERNLLSISGDRPARHDADAVLCERPHARFSRQLYLGENLDTENLKAEYENGVLIVTIPLSHQARARRIDINTTGGQAAIDTGSTERS